MDGWVSVYRKIQDKSWYRDSEYVHVWLHLILNANHSNKKVWVNGQEVELKRGQLLTSRKAISDKTGVTQSKIYRILNRYESEHQIEQQKTNKYTIITIVNYDSYQNCEQQIEQKMNNKWITNEQQMNTNNNDNNVNNNISNKFEILNIRTRNKQCECITKNGEKCLRRATYLINGKCYCNQHSKEELSKLENYNITKKFVKPTLEEVQKYIQEKNLKVNAEGFIDYYEANGWLVGKNHMKNWRATLRNWHRRQNDNSKTPEWFNKQIKEEKATDEEVKELEKKLNSN